MKKKPLPISLVAIGYFLAPSINVWQAWLNDRGFDWHDYLLMTLYPIVGYGLIRLRAWGWYLLLAHAAFLFVNNAIIGLLFGGVDRLMLLQLNILVIFLVWYFLRRTVASPFHDPALRWWERQSPRFGTTFAAKYQRGDHLPGAGTGFNLSSGGCFVGIEKEHDLARNDRVDLELRLDDLDPFVAEARVAWLSDGSEENPRGVGLEFARVDRENRRRLYDMIARVTSRTDEEAAAVND